jgi:DNA-binding transcriptional regulator YiaG
MEFAQAVRAARAGESQQAFATRVGATVATLRAWEMGRAVPAHYRHVVALIEVGVDEDTIRQAAAEAVAG